MRLSAANVDKYPKFGHFVRHDIPKVARVSKIVTALCDISTATPQEVRTALAWGSGPMIHIVPGPLSVLRPSACGSVHAITGKLRITFRTVERFQSRKSLLRGDGITIDMVGVTLLHELCHWLCWSKENWQWTPEQGDEFERRVYGGTFPICS